jgi:hypothetical protein
MFGHDRIPPAACAEAAGSGRIHAPGFEVASLCRVRRGCLPACPEIEPGSACEKNHNGLTCGRFFKSALRM